MNTENVADWSTILLVDPVFRSQLAVAEILEALPVNLVSASYLHEAAKIINKSPPQCVISEIRFSDGHISDLILLLRRMNCEAPVIVYSGSLTRDSLKSVIPLGIHATITKPPQREVFLTTVQSALDKRIENGNENNKDQNQVSSESEGSATILVQDDVGFTRYATAEVLKRIGYNVLESENVATGLKLLRDQHVDLVITDLVMPGKDGLDFLYECRQIPNRPPVLVLTCTRDTGRIQEAMRLGARGILVKPVEAVRLGKAVQECILMRRSIPHMSWGDGVVLIVDDDIATNHAFEVMLQKKGLKSVVVTTSYDALREGAAPNIVAAVVSMDLTGYDMPELVRNLVKLDNKPNIILTYRKLGPKQMIQIAQIGASKVLEKPYDIENLVDYIEGFVEIGEPETAR